jgi:DNA topoisomerase I
METVIEKKIHKRQVRSLRSDPAKAAAFVNLRYVNDKEPGITRLRKGDSFHFVYNGKKVTDKNLLDRIRKLVIPPAWENVWICPFEDGHLQVTGIDALKRKQYKYHTQWNSFRNHTKFSHLHAFGKCLPSIREKVQKEISVSGLPLQKVLAAIIMIMEETTIRIGNASYERLYGSFGLTTLKDQHVKINGTQVKFSFKGKKGVYHNVDLKSKKLAHIIKQCRDIPGKELFQYYNDEGQRQSVDSGMVNDYIKSLTNGDFTAKDFRTWIGTVQALEKLKEFGCCDTVTETKRKIVEVLDHVAKQLGNTRTVCKKYYVHPLVLDLYTDKSLEKYWKNWDDTKTHSFDLKPAEKVLMKILETN